MTNEIQTSQTFEERMKNKLRDSMGELLTDDELLSLITKGIDTIFFQERKDNSHYHATMKPPLIQELLLDELKPLMTKTVKRWAVENKNLIEEKMNKVVDDGAGMLLVQSMNDLFNSSLNTLRNNVGDVIVRITNGKEYL